ncbi:MAG: sigma-70 family RNA polymerase sigma factor [Alphaproteobacteria bacterium]|nr:sigma-70 family RNA polymerase sigma factor [Alphaproteobacteria bacterium]USO08369.1 MAG: sigma-70 family RNA polymerase sigma factor [Rhodospirillales bacterium]
MLNQAALVQEMGHLRKFASRLCIGRAEAEDLLQSTLLRAIEKKHLFENGTDVFKWTSKIMFNLFVSNYRRRTKFESLYDPAAIIEREGVEASSETKVQLVEVEEAMQKLSGDHRDILIMVCIKGMQYQEVAEILDVPLGTVRSRLSRAREHLQALMDTPRVGFVPPHQSGYYKDMRSVAAA